MIGKYIVYEGAVVDHLSVRQVSGDAGACWKVRHCSSRQESLIEKSSLGPYGVFDTEEEAKKRANQMTDKLIKARKMFCERRNALFAQLYERP